MKCPYCAAAQGRCATTSAGRFITECISCGRVVEERQTQSHHLFHIRAQDSPLCLVTSDLPTLPHSITDQSSTTAVPVSEEEEEDPFEPTGFITAFSTWSLEPYPVFAQSSLSFAGHLAELERVLETTSSSSASGPSVVVDNLRAYLQIIDVASLLGLDCDISDHAFQLFRDCSSATCLRNRSVEALATAALVQAIREAQEPRTLQEISIAANLPQKEIGKYIKILGEALQLSQPLNSNSISVHMPRFCTLLQLNKSAQELATHIGEVVINKCFCTRRNPISISAAAIYLASQLEDKRKTQAEICKVTGLTEVTLRKVYKELLENWDDLLPSNYTPAIPPEKAFPTATIASGRSSSTSRINDGIEAEIKPVESTSDHPWKFPSQSSQEMDVDCGVIISEELEKKRSSGGGNTRFWPPVVSSFATPGSSQANARSMQKPEVVSSIGDLNRHGNDNRS
ncbi:plant-specific TFIIB-related protein 1 [Cynara cardunculus var. scolymus]|uniref:Cyclin-like protein n=1 Tax=Cynara cardunculus var. scolymus TaxID=59895 RepID=A0A103Y063_CYNCS|nr:plant-specific TFIIB-related protein 1 [Cynara cardunculus var. scolymus]KVI00098.1 Cyclin-like protein [Cynara cardunculus var. scolymus]